MKSLFAVSRKFQVVTVQPSKSKFYFSNTRNYPTIQRGKISSELSKHILPQVLLAILNATRTEL